jgi:hypothetical protein
MTGKTGLSWPKHAGYLAYVPYRALLPEFEVFPAAAGLRLCSLRYRAGRVEYHRGSGPLAQRLEQGTHNPLVVGSNPTGPTRRIHSLQKFRASTFCHIFAERGFLGFVFQGQLG